MVEIQVKLKDFIELIHKNIKNLDRNLTKTSNINTLLDYAHTENFFIQFEDSILRIRFLYLTNDHSPFKDYIILIRNKKNGSSHKMYPSEINSMMYSQFWKDKNKIIFTNQSCYETFFSNFKKKCI